MRLRIYFLFCCVIIFPVSGVSQHVPYGKDPYITQLHIHGWSNHNGATLPGSIQFHNWQSDSAQIDVLWWTEHHNLFNQETLPLSFSGSQVDSTTLNITGIPGNSNGSYNGWICKSRDGISSADLSGDSLKLKIISSQLNWERFSYSPGSLLGLIRDLRFVKPLASLPTLNFSIDPHFSHPDHSKMSIEFRLSWHHRGLITQDIIIFDLIHHSLQATTTTNHIDSVFVSIPLQPGKQLVNLDVAAAAALLNHGIDNTISDIEVMLMAKDGYATEATLSDFSLIPLETEADSIIKKEKEILDYYSMIGETHNILGVEYSRAQHLNGFLPKHTTEKEILMGRSDGDVSNWVDKVHQHGGLVSYNHMFGANWGLGSDIIQDYRADTMSGYLFDRKVFGADILEVGYIKRGGADLRRHLKVWDQLTARGLFVYGNGVSDSHGDLWMDNKNVFHTWIYANDSSDTELLSALSRGKMCFGTYSNFKGNFWYSIANLELGDRGFSNAVNASLKLHLTGAPAGSNIKLTQAFITDSPSIQYVFDEMPLDPQSPPELNLLKPCFIRLGVYDSTGIPLIIGQPIVVLGYVNDSLNTTFGSNSMVVFPNPVQDKITMELNFSKPGNYSIRLLNQHSQEVAILANRYFYKGKSGFNYQCSHLPSGYYIIEVSNTQEVMTSKVIKL